MAITEEIIADDFIVTAQDVANKYVLLSRTPVTPTEVAVNVGGVPQLYGLDFYVTGKFLAWDSLALEVDLAAGDRIRAVYGTEGSINTFATTPQRDGIAVTSTVNTEALIPLVDSDDYFNLAAKLFRVDITYVHEDGRQTETIMHLIPALTGQAVWSTEARAGLWRKVRARLVDHDGAELYIGRGIIGSEQDLTLS